MAKKNGGRTGPPSLGRKRPRKQTARPGAALLRRTRYRPGRSYASEFLQCSNPHRCIGPLLAGRFSAVASLGPKETSIRPAIAGGASSFWWPTTRPAAPRTCCRWRHVSLGSHPQTDPPHRHLWRDPLRACDESAVGRAISLSDPDRAPARLQARAAISQARPANGRPLRRESAAERWHGWPGRDKLIDRRCPCRGLLQSRCSLTGLASCLAGWRRRCVNLGQSQGRTAARGIAGASSLTRWPPQF